MLTRFNRILSSPTLMVIALIIATCTASPQTKWFKYEGNPVFDRGPLGAWDNDLVRIDRVIHRDSLFEMWYSGGWDKGQIGHAVSHDGVSWRKDRRNPVLRPRRGTWESWVHRPYVIVSDSGYHMWYTSDSITNFRICYAGSPDGVNWRRYHENPVVDGGAPGTWDEEFAGLPSVLGLDGSGEYRMWYQGKDYKIGYATATDETSWTKYPEPVFWGDDGAWYPRVILNGGTYEMWYGFRDPLVPRKAYSIGQPGVFGYATSPDGIHWTQSPENPILRRGPPGTWDVAEILIGDIAFDGQLYHMWYNAHEGTYGWRGGYAVSPRGMTAAISASNAFVRPRSEAVRIAVHLPHPEGLSVYAKVRFPAGSDNPESRIELQGMHQEAFLQLFDDGCHGDSLAGDGILANSWVPTQEKLYYIDLKLRLSRKNLRDFEMNSAATFTTIGPVICEKATLIGDQTPNPGDTVLVRLTLRNKGSTALARAVAASLSTRDPSIVSIAESSPLYGDILAGKSANTLGYYRLYLNPYSPFGSDAKVNISISSWGIPLWYDSFTIRIVPPWWRSIWAYGTASLLLVGLVVVALRYVEVRRLKRKISQLEVLNHERARISQDMHDEVGATLTEIAILSELAKKKPQEAGTYVQQISDRAARVIDNLGEIIWAMNPRYDSLDNLVGHLRRTVTRHLGLANIECRFSSPDSIPTGQITSEARRNILLVVKEAVHNAVKHSGATKVSVTVALADHGLQISIADTGAGFDLSATRAAGNGLENMRKRMADIGGKISIESQPGKGTRVTLIT